METRRLRYFVTVIDEGGFTAAADRLGVSQPTLSQQIRQLEAVIGAPLFDRLGRRVSPTQVGTILEEHARRALRAIDSARNEINAYLELERGPLRLGAIQSFIAYLIPPLAAAYRKAHPHVVLQITEASAPRIERMLIDGRLDLGMAFSPALNDEVRDEPIFEEELVLVTGETRSDEGEPVHARTLGAFTYALFAPGMATRRIIDEHLASVGVVPSVGLEMNTIEGLLRAVEKSDLATIMPLRSVRQRSGLHVRRIVEPTPIRRAALLWPRGAFAPPVATAFAELLKHQLERNET